MSFKSQKKLFLENQSSLAVIIHPRPVKEEGFQRQGSTHQHPPSLAGPVLRTGKDRCRQGHGDPYHCSNSFGKSGSFTAML